MKHFLITRVAVNPKQELLDSWKLRDKIFHEYTLPSVQSQTNKNFEWLLLIDSEFDKEVIKKYKQYWTVLTTNKWIQRQQTTINYINSVAYNEDYIITTRFDSDDIILPKFIDTIQDFYLQPYFPNKQLLSLCTWVEMDYITKDKFIYEKKYSNPFISLIEIPSQWIKTVNEYPHWEMEHIYNIEYIITNNPMWIRILHWYNAARKEVLKWLKKLSD